MSELTIERTYPIEPTKLFAYVTETRNLLAWWGPDGATIREANLDFTKTGPWLVIMESPRGSFEMRGEVLAVTPPLLVEFTMNVPGVEVPDCTVRFEIAPDGRGGSRFTLIQMGMTDEMVEMGKRGWGLTLTRLEKLMGIASQTA
jgi:uncharacterized protein YndB with AHSA1/START domain